jgi:hypothetical protein
MAPPELVFPVSDLDRKIHGHTVNYKEKSRKLPQDFDLKRDCELMELVQYSCTTPDQQIERALASGSGRPRMECFPIVRLFRKYAGLCNHSLTQKRRLHANRHQMRQRRKGIPRRNYSLGRSAFLETASTGR